MQNQNVNKNPANWVGNFSKLQSSKSQNPDLQDSNGAIVDARILH